MRPIASWSPALRDDAARMMAFADGKTVWRDALQSTAAQFADETLTIDAQIGVIQRAHRLLHIHIAGLGDNAHLRDALASAPLTNWDGFTTPPADTALQERLGDMLDIAQGRASALVELGDMTRHIGPYLIARLLNRGVAVDVAVFDDNARATILNAADMDGVRAVGEWINARRMVIEARIFAQHNLPDWTVVPADAAKMKLLRQCMVPYRERVLSGGLGSVLTLIPTRADARADAIDFDEYTTLFFRMCDQPWDRIERAQAHLIERLNAADTLRFTNSDGTDISCSINGFTFCNSVVKRNIPGSEVFSAPVRDSVNGIIVSKGRFSVKEEHGIVIDDLTLQFKDGYLFSATARTGQEHLDHALSVDEGARYVGEVAIGTNPYLKRHLASILLAEKIGGSFHMALGDAYQMTDYLGTPVTVDNGNRSLLHWDITTMLWGKSGKIFVDGTMIMDDGVFLDPALAVLNFGWWAVPENERPAHWNAIINATKESAK